MRKIQKVQTTSREVNQLQNHIEFALRPTMQATEQNTSNIAANTSDIATTNANLSALQAQVDGALSTVRGMVNDGSVTGGENFTAAKVTTGTYDVTFSSAFASVPAVVAVPQSNPLVFCQIDSNVPPTVSGFRVVMFLGSSLLPVNGMFHFIAVGVRA